MRGEPINHQAEEPRHPSGASFLGQLPRNEIRCSEQTFFERWREPKPDNLVNSLANHSIFRVPITHLAEPTEISSSFSFTDIVERSIDRPRFLYQFPIDSLDDNEKMIDRRDRHYLFPGHNETSLN